MHFEESFQKIMLILASVDKWTIFLMLSVFIAFLVWMTSETPSPGNAGSGLGRFNFGREKIRERQHAKWLS